MADLGLTKNLAKNPKSADGLFERPFERSWRGWLLAGAAVLALCGCSKAGGDQPSNALAPVAQGAPIVDAPPADSLPPAEAVPVSEVTDPEAAYAFPDRAYEMSDMFGDAPPDYVYDYDGYQPWVWISDDGSECVAEAVPGGERYYYYEAGADAPFFIQDPTAGYGFDGGRLVAVYDRSGRVLPVGGSEMRAQIAGRYLTRARALYDASRHDTHLPVAQSNWMARRDTISAQRQTWQRQISADPNWRSFHAQNAPTVEAHWQGEKVQRLKWAAHVDEGMQNQALAARERQQAQTVAARPQQPSSPPGRVAGMPQREPQRAAAQPGQPTFAPPPSHEMAPREHFAQRPAPPSQGPQQLQPHENVARQDRHGNNPEPAPQQQQRVTAAPERALPPAERTAQAPRHEAPPPAEQAQEPPHQRAAQMPAREAPAPRAAPPQREAAAPRHEPPPQAPIAPPQREAAIPHHEPPPQAPVAPPQHEAAIPHHEPPPQAPAAPPPRVAMAPSHEPARPPAAVAPRAEHQQAPEAPKPHPAPAHEKDDKHKS